MNVIALPVQHRDTAEARVAAAAVALAAVAADDRQPEALRREAQRARLRLVEVDGLRHVLLMHQDAAPEAEGL